MRVGIMQGRLVAPEDGRFQSFPRLRWADEFERAAQAGLDCIEWIFDEYGFDVNPIATDEGIARIGSLSAATGVRVLSVCADWFMEHPLVRATPLERDERIARLRWLLERCQKLGGNRIVIPFVDASRIESSHEREEVRQALLRVLPMAEGCGVELHLETSLSPAAFADLLETLPHPMLKANYDAGNSASLGYKPGEEFSAYGDRIGSIHIKDRVLGGGTVSLGTGDADFKALFEAIKRVGYQGDFILQAARGAAGEEVALASANREQVVRLLAGEAP